MVAARIRTPWTALVTGGASGIGAAVSRKLASRSINVLLADVNAEAGEKLAQSIQKEFNVDAVFQQVDVSNEDDIKGMIDNVKGRWGRLDYAANVAGICEPIQFEEQSITSNVVNRTFAINQRGTWLCQKYEAQFMMSQEPRELGLHPAPQFPVKPQRGSIVNVASTTAVTGMGFAAYAPTKYAVIGITRNGALFYGAHGIRCNSIAPGGTITPMMLANMRQDLRAGNFQDRNSEVVLPIPLRTLASPEEQASVVSFLLSPESSHVTAVNIMVDGGWSNTRS